MTLAPEQLARQEIDQQLADCGWLVQDALGAGTSGDPGVAVRRSPIVHGQADYLLFVDETTFGVVTSGPPAQLTTCPMPSPSTGAEVQSGSPHCVRLTVAFAYLSTDFAIRFINYLQRVPRSGEVTRFHSPQELREIARCRQPSVGLGQRFWMDGVSVLGVVRTARRRGEVATVDDVTDVLDEWSSLTQSVDLASCVNRDWTEAGEELFPTLFGHELFTTALGDPVDPGRHDFAFTRRNPWEWIIPYHLRGHPRIAPLLK